MAFTGFLVNIPGTGGICADSSVHAIDSLAAGYPVYVGSPPMLCELYSSSFTAPNIFPTNIICHDLTSVNQYQFTHNIYLQTCDPALPIGGDYGIHSQADYVAAGELIFSALASVWVMIWTYRKISSIFHWSRGSHDE